MRALNELREKGKTDEAAQEHTVMYPVDLMKVSKSRHNYRIEVLMSASRLEYKSSILPLADSTPAFQTHFPQSTEWRVCGHYGEASAAL
jgi:hypothetical protein